MEQSPIRQQLFLMQFRLRFHETALFLRQRAGNQVDRSNRKNCSFVLKIRMEMSEVV